MTWKVENEKNVVRYDIESSTDGIHFTQAGQVLAAGRDSYSYSDPTQYPASIVYYRLKTVDRDGAISYSRIVIIKEETEDYSLTAMPNPFTSTFKLVLNSPVQGVATLSLFGMDGRKLLQDRRNMEKGKNKIEIKESHKLSVGTYLLQLRIGNRIESIKVVKTN